MGNNHWSKLSSKSQKYDCETGTFKLYNTSDCGNKKWKQCYPSKKTILASLGSFDPIAFEGKKFEVPENVMITNEGYFQKFSEETEYMKSFNNCIRYPCVKDVYNDLINLLSDPSNLSIKIIKNQIVNYYSKYSDEANKFVTLIWTKNQDLTNIINSALVMDAVKAYDLNEADFNHYKKQLDKVNLSANEVISKCIKFMRLLNSYIVDVGVLKNKTKRTTYRGMNKDIMSNVKIGQTFRTINWLWTSEDLSIANKFKSNHYSEGIIVEFSIEASCFNAGKINEIGASAFDWEKETLIPPYTVWKMTSRKCNRIKIDVAQDNKNLSFDMTVTNS